MMPSNVSSVVDAYRGREPELMQRYQNSQELIYLLALQKLKSEKEAAMRDIQMKMKPQGEPPTIAQQREDEVRDLSMKEFATQVSGAMQQKQAQLQDAQRNLLAQGLAAAPGANTAMTPKAMAAGGIVAFNGVTGSDVPNVDPISEPETTVVPPGVRQLSSSQGVGILDAELQRITDERNKARDTLEGYTFRRQNQDPTGFAEAKRQYEVLTARQAQLQQQFAQNPSIANQPTPAYRPLGRSMATESNRATDVDSGAPTAEANLPPGYIAYPTAQASGIASRTPPAAPSAQPEGSAEAPNVASGLNVPELQRSIMDRLNQGVMSPTVQGVQGLATMPIGQGDTLAAIKAELAKMPQGNERQQELLDALKASIAANTAHGSMYPGMSPENLRARQQAIEQMRAEAGQEFDPKKQALAGLARFLLGAAGRTRGNEFAGAGVAGLNYLEQQAAAEKASKAQIRGEEESLRKMQEAEAVAKYGAKGKALEAAIQGQGVVAKLLTDMSEGDATRGNYLARTALELASRKDISDNELRAKLRIAAADLGVKLAEGQLDRVVKAAGVEAELVRAAVVQQDTMGQRRSDEISRLTGQLVQQSREAAEDYDKRKPISLANLNRGDPNLKPDQITALDNWEKSKQREIARLTQPLRDRLAALQGGRPNYSLTEPDYRSASEQGVRVTGVNSPR